MNSLFEKEEKENAISQLKIDLISRFYPFSAEQLSEYHKILNFDSYHLMNNELIKWDSELIETFKNKIDWSALWKMRNITLDFDFFKTYENNIEFDSIHLSRSIVWSDELVSEFGVRFDWSKWLITKEPLAKIENVRRFQDILDWSYVSKISLVRDENIINEFQDKWDWKKLSSNPHLPVSVEFIQKHIDKLDFDNLSQNPQCINLIYKFPNNKRWNWDRVIINPAINYNKESFEFLFFHYKKNYESKVFTNPILKSFALHNFLIQVFSRFLNDKSYFLNEEFIKDLPWDTFCKFCSITLTIDFIESHKDKLNFKETQFLRMHRDVITTKFIDANIYLFNPEHYSFYYLPITTNILGKYNGKVNWSNISSCETLDWTWEYIDANFENFNLFKLSENKGIYEKLIISLTDQEIIEFLNIEMKKK